MPRRRERPVIAAEAVVERGVRPLGDGDPDPLAAPGHVRHRRVDQGPRLGLVAAERSHAERGVRHERDPGRLLGRAQLVGQRRRRPARVH
jgi:hypothetical protein